MPPRYSYWTIILDGVPTAFRARDREDLLPTFKQLQRKNPDAVMKWFARGRLWESPQAASDAARQEREMVRRRSAPGDRRGPGWRPGGEHQDPRARFAHKKERRPQDAGPRPAPREKGEGGRPGVPADRPQRPRPHGAGFPEPGSGPAGDRPYGSRPPVNRPAGDRPHGSRPPAKRPAGDRPYGSRPPGDRPPGNRPPGSQRPGVQPSGDRSRGKWRDERQDRFGQNWRGKPGRPGDKDGSRREDHKDGRERPHGQVRATGDAPARDDWRNPKRGGKPGERRDRPGPRPEGPRERLTPPDTGAPETPETPPQPPERADKE
jgi:23S rRNA pseudouridine2605 synthase